MSQPIRTMGEWVHLTQHWNLAPSSGSFPAPVMCSISSMEKYRSRSGNHLNHDFLQSYILCYGSWVWRWILIDVSCLDMYIPRCKSSNHSSGTGMSRSYFPSLPFSASMHLSLRLSSTWANRPLISFTFWHCPADSYKGFVVLASGAGDLLQTQRQTGTHLFLIKLQ